MNTPCHIHNRVTIISGTNTTKYGLWKGIKPKFKYFNVFGSKCCILTYCEQRRKMNPKTHEGIFLGHSINSRAYMVCNKYTNMMMEFISVFIGDTPEDN